MGAFSEPLLVPKLRLEDQHPTAMVLTGETCDISKISQVFGWPAPS